MTMNTKKTVLATMLAAFAAAPLAIAPLQAQAQAAPAPQQAPAYVYSQAEIDQMLAPIALYPDPLLSQILMAATYPIEVSEAARWSHANPGLSGDDAVRAVQNEDWDPSVKSLVAFPDLLQRMDEKREWTRGLGDAFLAQETQLMDEVQRLRHRAQAAGSLRSDERIVVRQSGPIIALEPAAPDYVYVPYYDPLAVYGPWWYPDYQPVAWAPWPGYVRYYQPGLSVGFWWGRPIGVSLGFFFGDFDWGRRHVRVAYPGSYYYRQPAYANRYFAGSGDRWYHDSFHRRGVDYRNVAVRQRYANEAYTLGQRQQFSSQRFAPQARQSTFAPQTQAPAASADRQAQREARRQSLQPQVRTQAQTQARIAPQSNVLGQNPADAQARSQARIERQAQREARRQSLQPQFQPQARTAPQQQFQPQARQAQPQFQRPAPQVQARPAPQAPRGGGYALGQHPREQRAAMPPAQAIQQPRAAAPRQEQRAVRQEQRPARGGGGGGQDRGAQQQAHNSGGHILGQ